MRFGIMVDGNSLIEPLARAVNRVLAIPSVELALLIVDRTPHKSQKRSYKKLLWTVYKKFLPVVHRSIDMGQAFARAERMECVVERKSFSEYFLPRDVEAIRGYNLDFILRFAFGIIRGDILQSARYGVWSYHHGDEVKYRGGPAGFWEVNCGERITCAVLQRLTEKLDGGIVLQKCYVKTRSSYPANVGRILAATSYMPARVCRDILNGNGGYVSGSPVPVNAPIRKAPTNREMALFFLKMPFRLQRRSEVVERSQIVFEHDGERYWVPDASHSRTVCVYRFVRERWQQAAVLIEDFPAVDATLLHDGRLWWLFCTNADEGLNTALYIWYAQELAGPWAQHAQNPVKMDVRSSRSAGPFYLRDGNWRRPVQDRSNPKTAIRTCQITSLTPTEFSEEDVT